MMWDAWKKGFEAWEESTARYTQVLLKSPMMLGPSGAMLSAVMRAKTAHDRAATAWWSAMGLPTKRDQEKTLHVLRELESRLMDLEERLVESSPGRAASDTLAEKK